MDGNFSLDVSYTHDSVLSDEVPNTLFEFLLQELLEPVGAEIIEKLSEVILLLFIMTILATNMEVHSDIDRNHDIVLCRDVLDGALESNCIFCDHCSDPFRITECAEAAMKSWLQDSVINSECLR